MPRLPTLLTPSPPLPQVHAAINDRFVLNTVYQFNHCLDLAAFRGFNAGFAAGADKVRVWAARRAGGAVHGGTCVWGVGACGLDRCWGRAACLPGSYRNGRIKGIRNTSFPRTRSLLDCTPQGVAYELYNQFFGSGAGSGGRFDCMAPSIHFRWGRSVNRQRWDHGDSTV